MLERVIVTGNVQNLYGLWIIKHPSKISISQAIGIKALVVNEPYAVPINVWTSLNVVNGILASAIMPMACVTAKPAQ
jgi:hypothetical protein